MRIYPWIIMSKSTLMAIHLSMWIQWLFPPRKLNEKINDPKMTFDSTSVEVTCVPLPKDHCIQVLKFVDTVTFFLKKKKKIEAKVIYPKSVEVTCVTLPKDHCVQVPWKYINVCGYSDPFFKNLNQRSLTPRWPLTPCLLRSHVWLYPMIIVPKSHGNTSIYESACGLVEQCRTPGR